MTYRLTKIAVATTLTLSVALTAQSAMAERWKMHSAFTSGTPILGPPAQRISEAVETMSDGDFEIKVFEPGAIVTGTNYYDAVSDGAIDAAYGTTGYDVGKNSAYAFFAAVPFGPGAGEFLAWMKHGGGEELAQDMYARDGIHFMLCGMIAPETAGWFRNEINSPEDLRGLKMRFFGLGARVMEKLGVSTQLLAGGDIYPALELGTIDAAEFSMPAIDNSKGFYQVAQHNYFPGWHQQSTTNNLLINKESWDDLTPGQQSMLETACLANITTQFAEGEALQYEAMQKNAEAGAIMHTWSDEMLATFESAWDEVVAEEVAENADAKRIWESLSEFRANYAVWGDRGYLK